MDIIHLSVRFISLLWGVDGYRGYPSFGPDGDCMSLTGNAPPLSGTGINYGTSPKALSPNHSDIALSCICPRIKWSRIKPIIWAEDQVRYGMFSNGDGKEIKVS